MKKKQFSKPGQSRGLLYKHLCQSLFNNYVTHSSFVKISVWHRNAQMVGDGAFSHKICCVNLFRRFQIFRPSKFHDWYKSYGNFSALVDFSFFLSCVRKVLSLQPAQQACFLFILRKNIYVSFFQSLEQTNFVQNIRVAKKNALRLSFLAKVYFLKI